MIHLLLIIIYLSFISLGLPDGLLGAAWPTMYPELGVSVSLAGGISIIVSLGTVCSSLMSERLTARLGTGKVTAISVAMTAVSIFGFSTCRSYWMMCLWAIPYGLGAGSVDASLNNYVAIHYSSRHMSWLHCMWGVGAAAGPYVMGYFLSGGGHWSEGYRTIGGIQVILTVILVLSLRLWKGDKEEQQGESSQTEPLSIAQALKIPGAKEIMVSFFCYCALEQTTALWASSYLAMEKGVAPETAAFYASMFFIGITIGRGLNGFLTMKCSDTQLIHLGFSIILVGIIAMFLPLGTTVSILGLVLIGLGCAPIYPCIIHSTPEHFGTEHSQAIIGIQMASANSGILLMPPLFGLLSNVLGLGLLPVYLLVILVVMTVMHEKMLHKCE